MTRLIPVALVAGILVAPSGALAGSPGKPKGSPGAIGIRLVALSPAASSDSLSRVYIVDRAAPGTILRRRVEISNSTRSTATVAVYASAASVSRGSFAFASGHTPNELSSWTTLARHILRLPPGTSTLDTVSVDVPKAASPGERYSVVWAEVSLSAPVVGGVTLVNRVGIRMYVSVGQGGAPLPAFTIGAVGAGRSTTGERIVVASVRNGGGRSLAISGKLTLSGGPAGLSAGPFPVALRAPLAPHSSQAMTVRLDKRIPNGPWRVQLQLRTGFVERTKVATVTFPVSRTP